MVDYKISGGNVYFKEDDMVDYSHWGGLYISEPTETENQYEVKKFDLAAGQYLHSNELTEWQGNAVADGYFTVEPEPAPAPDPTQSDRIEANTDYIVMMLG